MDIFTIAIRLGLAMLLGGVVGIERQTKHRPAGFRTHILVCTGSALIMCLTEYMVLDYGQRFGVTPDPFRLGAQVISGIGFLGAGTIINFGASVKGLTTAAGLWSVACIGLATGAGFYTGAVITTFLIVTTLFLFSKVSTHLDESVHSLELIVETNENPSSIGEITFFLGRSKIRIVDIEYLNLNALEGNKTFRLVLLGKNKVVSDQIVASISKIEGILRVERI